MTTVMNSLHLMTSNGIIVFNEEGNKCWNFDFDLGAYASAYFFELQ
jgi:hypothetical protein